MISSLSFERVTWHLHSALGHPSESFILASQVSLELGGNAPCIVFDDADIDVAVKGTVSYNLQLYTYL